MHAGGQDAPDRVGQDAPGRFTLYVRGRHVQLMTFQLRSEAFSHK